MKPKSAIEKINSVLYYFKPGKPNQGLEIFTIHEDIRAMHPEIDSLELREILVKLVKDQYLRRDEFKGVQTNIGIMDKVYYYLTFEGELFQLHGGYKKQYRNNKLKVFNIRVQALAVVIGGFAAAVYYVLEILRIYILPYIH